MDISNPFAMVVAIALIVMGAGVVRTWLAMRANAGTDREMLERVNRLEAEVSRLSERVRTLEKVVTDPEHRLREDFSRLA